MRGRLERLVGPRTRRTKRVVTTLRAIDFAMLQSFSCATPEPRTHKMREPYEYDQRYDRGCECEGEPGSAQQQPIVPMDALMDALYFALRIVIPCDVHHNCTYSDAK